MTELSDDRYFEEGLMDNTLKLMGFPGQCDVSTRSFVLASSARRYKIRDRTPDSHRTAMDNRSACFYKISA